MCNCNQGADVDVLLQACKIQDVKLAMSILIGRLGSNCCFGELETIDLNPTINPLESVLEAFPDGIGAVNCGCPVVWIKGANDSLFFSLDSGLTWGSFASFAACTINIPITVETNNINDQNNEDLAQYILSKQSGCKIVFAYGSNGIIYNIDTRQNAGEGVVGQGNWCPVCSATISTGTLMRTDIFEYTGDLQSVYVPENVETFRIKLWGAGGGGVDSLSGGTNNSGTGLDSGIAIGGAGGYTEATFAIDDLSLIAGDELYVVVGQGGSTQQASEDVFGFGGAGNNGAIYASGGGGLSGLFFPDGGSFDESDFDDAIAIAGGGGGGDRYSEDATTGFNFGGSGNDTTNCGGESDMQGLSNFGNDDKAGGGGGYEGGSNHSRHNTGGAPASGNSSAGEGGCGFTHASALTSDIQFSTEKTSVVEAQSQPLPPNNSDDDYITGVGVGSYTNWKTGDYDSGSLGGNGLVVIEWIR